MKLFAENDRIIPLCSKAIILLLSIFLLDDSDFLFYLATQTNLMLFAHIVNHETTKVLVRNTSDQLLHILRHQKLGYIVDIYYNNCFLANAKSALNSAFFSLQASPFFKHELSCIPTPADPFIETRLNNGVKVYGDKHTLTLLV